MRGFTLIEMMIVVSIIALFAALASPSVIRLVRDQRVLKETQQALNVYREAKARSMGSGAAVMVRYDPAGDTTITPSGPQWQVIEARDTVNLPWPECLRTNWTGAAVAGTGGGHLLLTVGMGTNNHKSTGAVSVEGFTSSLTGALPATGLVDICYSPKGKAFQRLAGASHFDTLDRVIFSTQRIEPDGATPVGLKRAFVVTGIGVTRLVEPCVSTPDCGTGQSCNLGACSQ